MNKLDDADVFATELLVRCGSNRLNKVLDLIKVHMHVSFSAAWFLRQRSGERSSSVRAAAQCSNPTLVE